MLETGLENSGIGAELYDDYGYSAVPFAVDLNDREYYTYLNSATCPDCGGSMARLGNCFACPACGFSTCHV